MNTKRAIRPFPILIDSASLQAIDESVRARARADWASALEGAAPAALDRQVELEIGKGIAGRWPEGLPEEMIRGLYVAARLISPTYAPDAYLQHQPAIRHWVAEQGHPLDESGGSEAMRHAYHLLKPLVGAQVMHLSQAWNGVGSWRH